MDTDWYGVVTGVSDVKQRKQTRPTLRKFRLNGEKMTDSADVLLDVDEEILESQQSDSAWERYVQDAGNRVKKRKGRFLSVSVTVMLLSIPFIVSGVVLYTVRPDVRLWNSPLGAWFILLSGVIFGFVWLSFITAYLLVPGDKGTGWIAMVMYFLTSSITYVRLVLFSFLLFGLWAGLFRTCPAYGIIIDIFAIPCIFFTCFLIAEMLTRGLALNYHRTTFFNPMWEALSKERWLNCLLTKREKSDSESEGHKKIVQAFRTIWRSVLQRNVDKDLLSVSSIASIRNITRERLWREPVSIARLEIYLRLSTLTFDTGTAESGMDPDELDRAEATVLGDEIYQMLRTKATTRYIVRDEFTSFLDSSISPDEVVAFFDRHGNGQLSRGDIIEGVITIFQQRRSLSMTLKDASAIVTKLGGVIRTLFSLIGIVVTLAIFQVDVYSLWLSFSAVVVGLSFVFGSTMQDTFEAVVYIFVAHPFDVLDEISVNGTQYTVKRLGLLTMELTRSDGLIASYPTKKLRQAEVHNISRSAKRAEWYNIHVDFDCPLEAIKELEKHLRDLSAKEPSCYTSFCCIVINGVQQPLKMDIKVVVEYAHNGANLSRLNWDRSRVLQLIVQTFRKYNVKYTLAENPIRLVNNPMEITTRTEYPDHRNGGSNGPATEQIFTENTATTASPKIPERIIPPPGFPDRSKK